MTLALLAQAPAAGAIAQWAIYGIIIVGVIVILLALLQWSGITIPPLFVRIAWIVVAVLFAVFAIKLLMSAL